MLTHAFGEWNYLNLNEDLVRKYQQPLMGLGLSYLEGSPVLPVKVSVDQLKKALISADPDLFIVEQEEWMGKNNQNEWWNEVFLTIYDLCMRKCKVLTMVEANNRILCVEFQFEEDIIQFYPHWTTPHWNDKSIFWDMLKERLTDVSGYSQYFETAKRNNIQFGVAVNLLSLVEGVQGDKELEMFYQDMMKHYYEIPVISEEFVILNAKETQLLKNFTWFAKEAHQVTSPEMVKIYGENTYFVPKSRVIWG